MKLSKEDYIAKISIATPLQLVIITYELVIDFVDTAKEHFDTDESLYEENIKSAQNALIELMSALDMQYEFSETLFQIYTYCSKLLMKAMFSKNVEELDVVNNMLCTLLDSWRKIEKDEADTSSLMENSQTLYAGLTYRNGKLEEFIDEDRSKGYSVWWENF